MNERLVVSNIVNEFASRVQILSPNDEAGDEWQRITEIFHLAEATQTAFDANRSDRHQLFADLKSALK